jgi:hypothetical protein
MAEADCLLGSHCNDLISRLQTDLGRLALDGVDCRSPLREIYTECALINKFYLQLFELRCGGLVIQ